MLVACGSVNWNWPGVTSVTPPSAVQLLNGSAGLVVASTANSAPTLLVKQNWHAPLVSLLASVRVVAVGTGTLILSTLPVLGMPLTNTVASAYPGGKPHTGAEVKELRSEEHT